MDDYGVVLFHTTSAAFTAEKALRCCGIDCKLIPTPRQFSSDCGVALRFDWLKNTEVPGILTAASVETAEIRKLD